jgi:adenine C2-methylase RlmN of 23S rRNA A2503 and tRNA A37
MQTGPKRRRRRRYVVMMGLAEISNNFKTLVEYFPGNSHLEHQE